MMSMNLAKLTCEVLQAIVKQMELENHDLRRLQNDCQQLAAEENYKTPIEFLLRTRQLVRADHVKCPSSETRSSILLGIFMAAFCMRIIILSRWKHDILL